MGEFIVFPAIDLRGGNVVRLRQGDYDDETVYGEDPVAVAESFVAEGATWIHMVDLDAAKGDPALNRSVIARVAAVLAGRARLQVGGGIRSVADAHALATAGVARVVMGSAAVRNPSLVSQVASMVDIEVAVGLDHRAGVLATEGWTQSSGVVLGDALGLYPAASCAIVTDISRDGMLTGPDIEGLSVAAEKSLIPIIASGGVGTIADIAALSAITNIGGVITGKAIYEGRFSLGEALRAVSGGAR